MATLLLIVFTACYVSSILLGAWLTYADLIAIHYVNNATREVLANTLGNATATLLALTHLKSSMIYIVLFFLVWLATLPGFSAGISALGAAARGRSVNYAVVLPRVRRDTMVFVTITMVLAFATLIDVEIAAEAAAASTLVQQTGTAVGILSYILMATALAYMLSASMFERVGGRRQ